MTELPLGERVILADKLRSHKEAVAATVIDQFYQRHPEWIARYGERGYRCAITDASFHLDHLAAALEAGSMSAFEEYTRWAARVLQARGIQPKFLAENLVQLGEATHPYLSQSEQGYTAGFLLAGCAAAVSPPPARPTYRVLSQPLGLTRGLLMQALLRGDRKGATATLLEALREGHLLTTLYLDVLEAALIEVGMLWELNHISVAEEHMATLIVQGLLAWLHARQDLPAARYGKALVTGVEGELHQVGATMVASLLEAEGWEVRFAGTNMPHEGILDLLTQSGADLMCISATMLYNVPKVRLLVEAVRKRFAGRSVRIVVGGSAFRHCPDMVTGVGADTYSADLRTFQVLIRS